MPEVAREGRGGGVPVSCCVCSWCFGVLIPPARSRTHALTHSVALGVRFAGKGAFGGSEGKAGSCDVAGASDHAAEIDAGVSEPDAATTTGKPLIGPNRGRGETEQGFPSATGVATASAATVMRLGSLSDRACTRLRFDLFDLRSRFGFVASFRGDRACTCLRVDFFDSGSRFGFVDSFR